MQSLSVSYVPLCKKGIVEVACVYSSTLGVPNCVIDVNTDCISRIE